MGDHTLDNSFLNVMTKKSSLNKVTFKKEKVQFIFCKKENVNVKPKDVLNNIKLYVLHSMHGTIVGM